ncbi:MAG TPA: hypothetical protein VGD26_08390, partial [Chitinophagaceae bacterium]
MKFRFKPVCLGILFISLAAYSPISAQSLIKEYVVFGKEAVRLGTSSNIIDGGKIGSNLSINSNGSATMNSDLNSGGTIVLGNSNNINGNISVSNLLNEPGNIFQGGSNILLNGRLDVNGNILISGGSVSGPVITSGSYQGPTPVSGPAVQFGSPQLTDLPSMPGLLIPATYAVVQPAITGTAQITPGSYSGITLTGNKTLTFRGAGDYVFGSISNSGNFNKFVFDFQNDPNRVFRIFVTGNVDLYKINVNYQ